MGIVIRRVLAVAVAVASSVIAAGGLNAQVAASDAAPFIGDWNVEVGGDAPATFRINITNADGQVAVAVTGSEGGNFAGTNIRKEGENFLFDYTTSIQGTQLPAAVTLTPEGEGLKGTLNLGGGMFTAPITATKRQ
jgi:hypothetical protein